MKYKSTEKYNIVTTRRYKEHQPFKGCLQVFKCRIFPQFKNSVASIVAEIKFRANDCCGISMVKVSQKTKQASFVVEAELFTEN